MTYFNSMTEHTKISYIKSGVRIFAYFMLPWNIPFAVSFLILSEILGIIEEMIL